MMDRTRLSFSVDDLYDILRCSLRHSFDKSRPLSASERETKRLEHAVRSSLLYHYKNKQAGTPVTTKEVLDFFSKLWYGDVVKKEDLLYSHTIKRRVPAANQASRWIIAYLKKQELRPSKPLLVDSPYKAKIGWHTVDGVFDLVQEVEIDGPRLEIVHFSFAKTRPQEFYLRTHLGLSIASYAFRTLFERREDRLTLAWLKGGELLSTYRTPADYKRLRAWIRQAVWYAREEPVPRFGGHCMSCPYQDDCLAWTGKGGEAT